MYVWAYTIYKQISTPTYKWQSTQNEQLYRKTNSVQDFLVLSTRSGGFVQIGVCMYVLKCVAQLLVMFQVDHNHQIW
jgi:hypothetical protein